MLKSLLCFLLLSCAVFSSSRAQPRGGELGASEYLESIRGNEVALKAFFHRMPKGGDLHHHFSGAIYAETFFDSARAQHFVLDTVTLVISPAASAPKGASIVPFDSMPQGLLAYYKARLIQLWSVKDFGPCDGAPDVHFFNTFGLFGPAVWGNVAPMLMEIKQRAIAEHTTYLETMFMRPALPQTAASQRFYAMFDPLLHDAQRRRDTARALAVMSAMLDSLRNALDGRALAKEHHAMLVAYRDAARLPDGMDSLITIRFQNYVTRTSSPANVFGQLYLSFASCDLDSLVMGVNIVAPENNDVSMSDYWLHMVMFRYMRTKFPPVHVAMHAGELVLGMVKPEELTWHISSAVALAGAERIGHGVDIAYEAQNYELLSEMARRHVAIEINLTSNEFILGVKNSASPILLYSQFHVPITINTDDPGVLRSDHTGEFVKLALRYPHFTYADIKQFVYNSIDYSFLTAPDKLRERRRLDRDFVAFEEEIAKH